MDEGALDRAAASELFAAIDAVYQRSEERPEPLPESCPTCNCSLVVRELEFECPECHRLFEAPDIRDVLPDSRSTTPGEDAMRNRLRVVGPEAGWYQPDLDRTNPGDTAEAQKRATYAELVRFNSEYVERGGNAFPRNVLQNVADYYNLIQKVMVKRSTEKRTIIACLLYYCCYEQNFARSRAEVSEFAQLDTHGIARGDSFLRAFAETFELPIDLNLCQLAGTIVTTFHQLDLGGAEYAHLRDAVEEVVNTAKTRHVGMSSMLRSKVVAATYEVLYRTQTPVRLQYIASRCAIRLQTVQTFLDELRKYHRFFVGVYQKWGLNADPRPRGSHRAAARKKKPPRKADG